MPCPLGELFQVIHLGTTIALAKRVYVVDPASLDQYRCPALFRLTTLKVSANISNLLFDRKPFAIKHFKHSKILRIKRIAFDRLQMCGFQRALVERVLVRHPEPLSTLTFKP